MCKTNFSNSKKNIAANFGENERRGLSSGLISFLILRVSSAIDIRPESVNSLRRRGIEEISQVETRVAIYVHDTKPGVSGNGDVDSHLDSP